MAINYGTFATNRDVTVPAVKNTAYDTKGKMRVTYDEYVAAGALVLNDTFRLGKLPANCRVHEVVLSADDLGTVGTLSVGWEDNGVDAVNLAGFIPTQDVHTAASVTKMSGAAGNAGMMKVFTAVTQVTAKCVAATDVAGTFRVAVYYAHE